MNRFLTVRKSLLSGASIAIIALAVPTVAPVAQAGTLPADQIVLDGSCLSMGDVLGAAQAALAAYVAGGPPAGVTINNDWVPAVYLLTNAGQFAGGSGLCTQIATTTTPTTTDPPTTTPPTTDPPTTDPPTTDPPTTDPPTTDPPTTDPPTTTPPTTDPQSWQGWGHGHHHGDGQGNWGQGNGGQGNGGQGNGGQGNGGQGNGGQGNWGNGGQGSWGGGNGGH
jgi:hypothetical protein